jgi:hypothetical protein
MSTAVAEEKKPNQLEICDRNLFAAMDTGLGD